MPPRKRNFEKEGNSSYQHSVIFLPFTTENVTHGTQMLKELLLLPAL
jgi:hypothetical protein